MAIRRRTALWMAGTGFAWLLATTLTGQALPKLPGPIDMPRSSDSPGQVVFNHATHVDAERHDCTVCHPESFRILKTTRAARIDHTRMAKGAFCGACHTGTQAFAIDTGCTLCHQDDAPR